MVEHSLTLTQESQSVASNYSVVRIVWKSTQSGQSYNNYTRTAYYYVTYGGVRHQYSVSYTLPKNSTATIVDTTVVVPHASDGTGSVTVETWMDTDIYYGIIEQSDSLTLSRIARKSSLSVPDGTLETAQNMTVTKQSSDFTHTITWVCGTATGTVCTKDGRTSVPWTPPINLASQAPQGNSVAVTFTITTYSGSTAIGTDTDAATYAIPEKYKPTLAYTVSDLAGHHSKYGSYLKGQSRLRVTVDEDNTYSSYGAWIASCKVEFEGVTYSGLTVDTNPIKNAGTLTVKVTVTDSRGRSTVGTENISVVDYAFPKIKTLTATRCDKDGNASNSGAYLAIRFSTEVVSLNSKNSVRFAVSYKKASASQYTEINTSQYVGKYTITDGLLVVSAETASSYSILFSVYDDFHTTTQMAIGASVKKLWSMLKKAGEIVGIAIGKIAEHEGEFEIAMPTRFTGGIIHPVLPDKTDLNTVVAGAYILRFDISGSAYTNNPIPVSQSVLEVFGSTTSGLMQRVTSSGASAERHYTNGAWGSWVYETSHVVEKSTSNGWNYRKWSDGTAECWKTVTHTTKVSTPWGSLFVGNTPMPRQNYPVAFTEKPSEIASLTSGGSMGMLYPELNGYGVNGVSASAMYNVCGLSSVTTDATFYISLYVTGKWK